MKKGLKHYMVSKPKLKIKTYNYTFIIIIVRLSITITFDKLQIKIQNQIFYLILYIKSSTFSFSKNHHDGNTPRTSYRVTDIFRATVSRPFHPEKSTAAQGRGRKRREARREDVCEGNRDHLRSAHSPPRVLAIYIACTRVLARGRRTGTAAAAGGGRERE